MTQVQNYKNHARIVPAYHYGAFFPLVINFVWAVYLLITAFAAATVVNLLLAIGLLLLFFTVRAQILTVQDRVIRLEMRLRLREVLPPDLLAQSGQLTVRQLIALRFASDAELPGLVREVLAGSLDGGKAIKMRIKDWQADLLRA
jgi:hypothetical protein